MAFPLDKFILSTAAKLHGLTDRYRRNKITLAEWNTQFSEVITVANIVAAIGGYELSPDDAIPDPLMKVIQHNVSIQLGFLKRFKYEIVNESEFKPGWLTRAETYASAIKIPYWRGKTKVLPLPAMPAQGTQCLTNCGCEWDIQPIHKGRHIVGYKCYWVRGKNDSCQTCTQRARDWAPLYIDIVNGRPVLRG